MTRVKVVKNVGLHHDRPDNRQILVAVGILQSVN